MLVEDAAKTTSWIDPRKVHWVNCPRCKCAHWSLGVFWYNKEIRRILVCQKCLRFTYLELQKEEGGKLNESDRPGSSPAGE